MFRGLVSFNFYLYGKFYLYKNYLNLDDKALAYFWTLKDKTLFEMFLFVELTQKMSISNDRCVKKFQANVSSGLKVRYFNCINLTLSR